MPPHVRPRTLILIVATLACVGLGVWGGSADAGVYLAMATVGVGALAIPVIIGSSRSAAAERARTANYAPSGVRTPPLRASVAADVATVSLNRDSLVRTYRAPSLSEAQILFRQDAAAQSLVGWSPASQSWAEGSPGVGRVLAIGLLAFAARPKGTLTVMYRRTT